jgi:hypothetical protein
VISAERSPQFRESSDEPSPLVDIELHQAFVSHFQQEGLASLLIYDIGSLHNLIHLERLLAERIQDILSIIQHDYAPTDTYDTVLAASYRRWPSPIPRFNAFCRSEPSDRFIALTILLTGVLAFE